MRDIKLVCTDIDGTIVRPDFTLSEDVKACIKKLDNMGIKVVLVSGRMPAAMSYVAEELELDHPISSYQGALITHNEDILYKKCLDSKIAKEVIDWASDNGVHLNVYLGDDIYVEEDNPTIRKYTGEMKVKYFVKSLKEVELEGVCKILAIDFDDEDKVSSWKEYLKKKYPETYIVKSTPYFCEVCSGEASKGAAVDYLIEHYGIERENVLTIGDQNNDLELIEAGGVSVAMGNATDELKKLADHVTDTVQNDGFVRAIEKFVKGYDEARL